jgi:hypothetical protein
MSLINTIVSDVNLTFTTTPIVQTVSTSDNSTYLASTAYVNNNLSTCLTTNTAQSLTTQTITPAISVSTIDATGTIQLGQTTDTSIILGSTGSTISIASYTQGISSSFPYWSTSSTNTTTSFGTATQIRRMRAGSVSMTSTAVSVSFGITYTTTPVVVIGQAHTVAFTSSNRWVTNVTTTGFTANVGSTGQSIHWIAVGI